MELLLSELQTRYILVFHRSKNDILTALYTFKKLPIKRINREIDVKLSVFLSIMKGSEGFNGEWR